MEGKMGECPEDYALVQAAKYYGVAPWELLKQSIWWIDRALNLYMPAEHEAQESIEQHRKK
jgi:hypothetical protein